MGRTNIEIDDVLVEKAMRLTGAKSKREAVDITLRRLVQKGSLYRALRRLTGKLVYLARARGLRRQNNRDQWYEKSE
jgi:Arc/MetJ family transcription regulator